MLNRVEVRRHCRPCKDLHPISREKIPCRLRGMDPCVILLKDHFTVAVLFTDEDYIFVELIFKRE